MSEAEINRAVAERVMGWKSPTGYRNIKADTFQPTTNPADAMAVLIACHNKCALILFNDGPDHSSISATTKENGFAFYAREDDEPMTVSLCKFALKLFP